MQAVGQRDVAVNLFEFVLVFGDNLAAGLQRLDADRGQRMDVRRRGLGRHAERQSQRGRREISEKGEKPSGVFSCD